MKKISFTLLVLSVSVFAFGQDLAMNIKPVNKSNTENAVFAWTTTEFDFGQIKPGVPVSHDFAFTNNGEIPLVISAVQASCGCTVTAYTKEPIEPGAELVYEFTASDPGTYFYHSHMGTQLDRGLYAPLVVEDEVASAEYGQDFTVLLDDWIDGTGETPDDVLARLQSNAGAMEGMDMGADPDTDDTDVSDTDMSGMDMSGTGTSGTGTSGTGTSGTGTSGAQSMSASDEGPLGDDTGDIAYPFYLVNGRAPSDPAEFAVTPGEAVRLRLVNAASDTPFRVALGGSPLTVIASDGFPVEPVTVDTILLGMGERYDVVVTVADGTFPLVASAEGKTGQGLAVVRTGAGRVPGADVRLPELGREVVLSSSLTAAESARLSTKSPDRTIDAVLGGTMAPYRWTINGKTFPDAAPLEVSEGERVRLRIINAAAQTNFNVRIPDLPMTVVQTDGQNVRPVTVDELQIGVAETFDVIVTPQDRAYSFVSESIDRSGLGRATLAPREGMSAPVPPLRPRPLLTMKDMGMGDHSASMPGMDQPNAPNVAAVRGVDPSAEQNASRMLSKQTGWNPAVDGTVKAAGVAGAAMSGMDRSAMAGMAGMDHSAMGQAAPAAQGAAASMEGMDHSTMGDAAAPPPTAPPSDPMAGMDHSPKPGVPGMDQGGTADMSGMDMRDFSQHPQIKKGPGVQTISPMPMDRTAEPPQGLEGMDHRVLTYRDLAALDRNPDVRAPSRQLELHLTGNMERYMWGFDGFKISDPAEPIPFRLNERVRVTLVNDTMMPHPIHLHGHFFELVTGHGGYGPRKHTINVPPGGKMTFDVTADAAGDWAFHCHNLYHMTAGMMRVVTVRPEGEAPDAA